MKAIEFQGRMFAVETDLHNFDLTPGFGLSCLCPGMGMGMGLGMGRGLGRGLGLGLGLGSPTLVPSGLCLFHRGWRHHSGPRSGGQREHGLLIQFIPSPSLPFSIIFF